MSEKSVQRNGDVEWRPDLIIGVDLGTTFTGVSYCGTDAKGGVMEPPAYICRWPGDNGIHKKVPTMISGGTQNYQRSWGFGAKTLRDCCMRGVVVEQRFKLLLGLDTLTDDVGLSLEIVKDWFAQYLDNLYAWISETLGCSDLTDNKPFNETKVEFLFSVPTTWKADIIQRYNRILEEVFGKVQNHRYSISQNEAEAAAAFVALCHPKEIAFRKDDLLLVCDAGGGTTDLSILKVVDIKDHVPHYEQLWVDGVAIGSTNIDEIFDEEVKNILNPLGYQREHPSVGEFESIKSKIGTKIFESLETISVEIAGLDKNVSNRFRGVSNGCIEIQISDIERIYDSLLSGRDANSPLNFLSNTPERGSADALERLNGSGGLFGFIDRQLSSLKHSFPNLKINYLVVSGGLGSSPYVQKLLKQRYCSEIHGMKMIIPEDPQLVVCRGLVINRLHQLHKITPIILKRISRSAFGLVWNQPYERSIHKHLKSERVRIKPDKHYYLPNRIHWFINPDSPLDCTKNMHYLFSRYLHHQDGGMLKHDIVRFDGRQNNLPDKLTSDTKVVQRLSYRISGDKELRNCDEAQLDYRIKLPLIGGFGKIYRVNYEVQVCAKDTRLKFDIFLDGRKKGSGVNAEAGWETELGGFAYQSAQDSDDNISQKGSDWT
ncbi:hypothetical protein EDC01DRAFT_727534 [Geopyxis carbonaria]|nr:hypothetical protein EDC01DRAFT_727534 [Geopyxis carbonaria]